MVEQRLICANITIADLQSMIEAAVCKAVNELRDIHTIQSEVRGINNCAKVLGIHKGVVSELLNSHKLGMALWKRETGRGNSPVMMEVEKALQRYKYYSSASNNVQESFVGDIAEVERLWQAINL